MPTFGSLFSGIGGFDLGLERAGWECAWQVEVDKDCVRVLSRHWPDARRFGDVRKLQGTDLGAVDLICGGFPCQDLSVAGRRAGLVGERSGLFFEFMRVVAEVRPAWVLVENVPGLLSSGGGRDMGTVLGTLGDLGYWWAYRVLDARHFGVAQRRRRVFIVGGLGNRSDAAQVLLEREGGGGDPAEGGAEGKIAPAIPASGAGTGRTGNERTEAEMIVVATLNTGGNEGGMRSEPGEHLVAAPITTGYRKGAGVNDGKKGSPQNLVVSRSLTSPQSPRCDGDTETFVLQDVRGHTADSAQNGPRWSKDGVSYTLGAVERHGVAFAENQRGETRLMDVSPSLSSGGGKPGSGYPAVAHALKAEGADASEDGTGRGVPLVVTPKKRSETGGEADRSVAYQCHGTNVGPMGTLREGDGGLTSGVPFVAATLTSGGHPNSSQPGRHKEDDENLVIALRTDVTPKFQEDVSFTLTQPSPTGGGQPPAVAFTERTRDEGRTLEAQEELAYALTNPASGGRTHSRQIAANMVVRRLTPTECERLQAFPDGWTAEDAGGKPISDSARYRMLGNAVATSVAWWLGIVPWWESDNGEATLRCELAKKPGSDRTRRRGSFGEKSGLLLPAAQGDPRNQVHEPASARRRYALGLDVPGFDQLHDPLPADADDAGGFGDGHTVFHVAFASLT